MGPTKATPEKLAKFCELIDAGSTVTDAAKGVGMSRFYVYELREKNAEFARAWASAEASRDERLEEEARRRALAGSDTLLIFLMKGAMPEKYRERYSAQIEGGVTLQVVTGVPDEGSDLV